MHSVYTYYSCDNINQKEFLTVIIFWKIIKKGDCVIYGIK